ncbi:unnamed protein product [Spirodela intermedia]|uniref:Uncharacterized protein n=2 Tax=Spirodela intermedia TaxID=51605 RepID=A0A7I8KSN4_SPIIN|nr:unnamed protein product [Spirodela intermedia]CAA6663621.1 unnamed protein product [Spirodela intermedia]CAA7400108.1 unnamed protein product [Spirodela intermedia]
MDGGVPCSSAAIWEEIDLAERYLVCCMFEAASSLSRSIIQGICNSDSTALIEDAELVDIMESAGMVFVQSLKELGRTSELIPELKFLFGTVAAVPGQVFLTGACMQIAEGFSSKLKATFEEFIGKWKYVEGHAFVCLNGVKNPTSMRWPILSTEKYLDIVGVYAISLLGMSLNDIDLAISWTEKAELPEERRQEILRKLQSLSSSKRSSSPGATEMHRLTDKTSTLSATTTKALRGAESFSTNINTLKNPNRDASSAVPLGSSLSSLFNRIAGSLWWFRTIRVKCGNTTLIIPQGKVLLWSSLVLVILHIFRRKQAILRRFAGSKVVAIKRALADAWQLAFSVQVNPLAAIQPIPSTAPGVR